MLKKSNSDLSTTLISAKDSTICKNIEQDCEQLEISALINSYNMIEDTTHFFKNSYALFEIKLYTPYKSWTIHKRYKEFAQLFEQLESKNIKNLPQLPPKLIFKNEQKLNERKLSLETFLNELFKVVNIIKCPIILDFIKCPKDLVDILSFNMDYQNASTNMNSTINNSISYYNGVISTNKNSIYNYNEVNNNNLYVSMAQFKINNNNLKSSLDDNNENNDDDITLGTLVVEEFLRNLMDISFNKTELLFQFEFFLKNRKNEDFKHSKNWFYLDKSEIEIFFDGFYSSISHTKINGFLFHCGNIQNNKIGTQKCLEFLNKLLSEDFNPQAEEFLKVFKRTPLENIIQMELENHIINNSNSNRINSFMILYKYVGSGKNMQKKIQRILMCPNAEALYMTWFKNQIL